MGKFKFTFLTEEQIFGEDKLDIISKYGTKCATTDFSILLGGNVCSLSLSHTSEGNTLKDRTSWWWGKSQRSRYTVNAVDEFGNSSYESVVKRSGGFRPVFSYSSIKSFCTDEVICANGIKEVRGFEYPQTIVDENYSRELERAYKNGILRATGKNYTTDSIREEVNSNAIGARITNGPIEEIGFKARTHTEYEYKGNKYVRIEPYSNCTDEVLTDGRVIEFGTGYWVRVEPITFLVDEEADIAIPKKILFSGIRFADIDEFMNKFFLKEIIPSKVRSQTKQFEKTQDIESNEPVKEQIQDNEGKEPVKKQKAGLLNFKDVVRKQKDVKKTKAYDFDFNEASEEDIIRRALESNIPVFLHGRPGEGKTERVKQLDSDCEIIDMRNATRESLNGSSLYSEELEETINTPPTWYLNILEKCIAEQDKIHIIFLDKLTSAPPLIQKIVSNIILDGAVNGEWKLPPNARIVASGNDLNDSITENKMEEQLYNQFAHAYINTTTESWLKWASTPKERYEELDYQEEEQETIIHPSIYAYLTYKSYIDQDVLRTPYTGDKPNADPRKWEMASKILYKTKQPEMLRALIGDDLTKDFIAFSRQEIISVEDVINHNYSNGDLEMDASEKFATALGLASVDDEHFEEARDFMKQLGEEPRAAFETMWSHGDEKRLERLEVMKFSDSISQGGMRR